jgi:hypothetical protein
VWRYGATKHKTVAGGVIGLERFIRLIVSETIEEWHVVQLINGITLFRPPKRSLIPELMTRSSIR